MDAVHSTLQTGVGGGRRSNLWGNTLFYSFALEGAGAMKKDRRCHLGIFQTSPPSVKRVQNWPVRTSLEFSSL